MSRLASVCASLGARRRSGNGAIIRRALSSSSSPSPAVRPREPSPLPLPTSASELSLFHGAASPALIDSPTGRVTTFSRLEATAEANALGLRQALGGLFDDDDDDDDIDDGEVAAAGGNGIETAKQKLLLSKKSRNVDPETGARASGPRVAVLGPPSAEFAAALWGIWAAGGCAVPLHHKGVPEAAMAAALSDVGASAVLFPPSSPSSPQLSLSSSSSPSSASGPSFEERAASLASLAAKTADANGRMLPAAPLCLPWSELSGGAEYLGGGGGEGDEDEDEDDVEQRLLRLSLSPSPLRSSRSRSSRGALVIFTSGTTGRPKPALHSHLSLAAQAASLCEAWELRGGGWGGGGLTTPSQERRRRRRNVGGEGDVVYNSLPWHHIHGLVNALIAPLAAGCAVEVAPSFSPSAAWRSLCRGRGGNGRSGSGEEKGFGVSSSSSQPPHLPPFEPFRGPVTVFMGVPLMYSHLLTSLEGERGGGGGEISGAAAAAAATPSNNNSNGNDASSPLPPRPPAASRDDAAAAAASLRLSICGSAACPVPLARAWDELVERGKAGRISREEGGRGGAAAAKDADDSSASAPSSSSSSSSSLLERYGMTEAGMILGQSLLGPRARGVVGRPMPGVEVMLRKVDGGEGEEEEGARKSRRGDNSENGEEGIDSLARDGEDGGPPSLPDASGELLVRWPGMFSAYWGRADATREAFLPSGWFATGDVAARGGGDGGCEPAANGATSSSSSYRLLGRASVDILKVGGEKLSALEIEDALLAHSAVAEAAVVALDGGVRGDAVGAVLVAKKAASDDDGKNSPVPPPPLPTFEELRSFASELLPKAAVPTSIVWVDSLPRNAMGKVDKKKAREAAFPPPSASK